ncbi:SDR family oxidoreductase [Pseudomonas aeruginosa]|uniref:SDR family oxidoreductase n=1 Tax=Pseudomonas aeruginosa TaxID=287 RepID=UPI000B4D2B58|nr:SDR family oxidoreductase [Pseudomonas aeruginosa]ASD18408.1 3-oxoacyl-ACP reductase [Pseudomonas aeruginosa]AVZ19208.1 SDR family oxidoreductase [Pseudomonas aeruginosa]MBG4510798.1 SDR family oxidoreductase [Pseudomonas aeruginosa]MBX5738691.1 SDR family oxidoreductase [Pseudomonas aeruginosa]MBX6056383.1 SDR family oxidoreductase [Pseudomonas aeruginosa]
MTCSTSQKPTPTILLIGASRGLGFALAAEFLKVGWNVVATVRGDARTDLHSLAEDHQDSVEIERLDVTDLDQISDLRSRLSGRSFDILFVNAGTANKNQNETIADVSTEEFVRVMVTNALAPMRVIEALQNLVSDDGLIGIMSSGQGSISNNESGGHEVYRGTKSALNQYMRSYAARHAGDRRALALIAPGWIRTELGGPDAPLTIEESIPDIVNVLLSKRERPGLEYLDRMGRAVPW